MERHQNENENENENKFENRRACETLKNHCNCIYAAPTMLHSRRCYLSQCQSFLHCQALMLFLLFVVIVTAIVVVFVFAC